MHFNFWIDLKRGIDLKKSTPFLNYSRSLRFGFRDGSLERKPKINNETKNITVV